MNLVGKIAGIALIGNIFAALNPIYGTSTYTHFRPWLSGHRL